jgi:hypothetical protein
LVCHSFHLWYVFAQCLQRSYWLTSATGRGIFEWELGACRLCLGLYGLKDHVSRQVIPGLCTLMLTTCRSSPSVQITHPMVQVCTPVGDGTQASNGWSHATTHSATKSQDRIPLRGMQSGQREYLTHCILSWLLPNMENMFSEPPCPRYAVAFSASNSFVPDACRGSRCKIPESCEDSIPTWILYENCRISTCLYVVLDFFFTSVILIDHRIAFLDEISSLQDPDLFRFLIELECSARTPTQRKSGGRDPMHNASYIASIVAM